MINVKNLDFCYGNKQVLHSINVQLHSGSITGLIGPNGAGKSTLMRCMAGLEKPTKGVVLLNDKPILENPRVSFTQLGYLPDIFGLPEDLTVIQCLVYAAKSRGLADSQLEKIIIDTLSTLNLNDKIYSKVNSLSRGQKQRVGIGQVIVHQPKFLLLDEPASGLDPEARYQLSLLLLKLKASNMTILVSSHILSELDEYCSHMLVIKEGKIQTYQALNDEKSYQTLSLEFFRLPEDGIKLIESIHFVQNVTVKSNTILVQLAQGEENRVALIRELVKHNLPLSSIQIAKASLLQSYQNSLNIHKE